MPHDQRIAGNADEARFRQGTGRPALLSPLLEPCPGGGMVYVIGPGKGYQYVDVQERRQGQSLNDW